MQNDNKKTPRLLQLIGKLVSGYYIILLIGFLCLAILFGIMVYI